LSGLYNNGSAVPFGKRVSNGVAVPRDVIVSNRASLPVGGSCYGADDVLCVIL